MKATVVLVLAIALGLGSCRHSPNQTPLVGSYDVQGFDHAGKLIFKGAIKITSFETTKVKGICKITKVDSTFQRSVEKAEGLCEGEVSGNQITLDLAPLLDDGGVVFEGQWNESRITGTWSIESALGATTFGNFEAVKQ